MLVVAVVVCVLPVNSTSIPLAPKHLLLLILFAMLAARASIPVIRAVSESGSIFVIYNDNEI